MNTRLLCWWGLLAAGLTISAPAAPAAAGPDTRSSAQLSMPLRSVRLNNMHNWWLVSPPNHTDPAYLQPALERLARRDCVYFTECCESVNEVPGWSKLTTQTLRQLHPDVRIYRWYDLMVKCAWDTDWGNAVPGSGERMQTPLSWSAIQSNNWWLRDSNGQIVKETDRIWFLDVGKPGFKEAYLQGVLDRLQGQGFDGVAFDYLWPDLSGLFRILGCPMPVDYPTDKDWFEKAWKPFFSCVMDGVHAAGYRIAGNCAGEYAYCSAERAFQRTKVDVAIYEQFCLSFLGPHGEPGDWLPPSTVERRIKELSLDPLEVWTSDATVPSDPLYDQKRAVTLAAYYIGIPALQDKRAYHQGYDGSAFWQPVWDFYIGAPAWPAVKRPGRYFWVRAFTKGLVLLNYETEPQIASLDRRYYDPTGKVFSGRIKVRPRTGLILSSATTVSSKE